VPRAREIRDDKRTWRSSFYAIAERIAPRIRGVTDRRNLATLHWTTEMRARLQPLTSRCRSFSRRGPHSPWPFVCRCIVGSSKPNHRSETIPRYIATHVRQKMVFTPISTRSENASPKAAAKRCATPGEKGAPSKKDFEASAKTAKKRSRKGKTGQSRSGQSRKAKSRVRASSK
jgi:hypothetical protein